MEEEISSLASERRNRIIELLSSRGSIAVGTLVDEFDVTPMTVWRDLKRLESLGQLKRVRGGAVLPNAQPVQTSLGGKDPEIHQKRAIAQLACNEFIRPGMTIFLDGGSTLLEAVRYLPTRINIITNSLPLLSRLHESGNWSNIQCSGGIMSKDSGLMTGPDARRFLQNKRADVYLTGCSGIDPKRGITDINPLEIEIREVMAESAAKVIVLADSSKLDKPSMDLFLRFDQFDCLITDDQVADDTLSALSQRVRVEAAPL